MKRVWTVLVSLLLLPFLTGCIVLLEGGGEVAVGMRNDNFLVLRHTVDGDKEGKTSRFTFEADDVLDLIVGDEDDAPIVEDPVADVGGGG